MYFFAALDDLKNFLENPDSMVEMKFLLLEQKYLELISKKSTIDALKVSIFFPVIFFGNSTTFDVCDRLDLIIF